MPTDALFTLGTLTHNNFTIASGSEKLDTVDLVATFSLATPARCKPLRLAIVSSNQDLVRVLEDVVELLISRGVILFTDLPDSAQHKMLHRQRLRSKLPRSLDLLGDD